MPLKRWLLLALLVACRTSTGATTDAPATSWHYEVRVDPALTRLEAKVCFQGVVPNELRAGKDEAAGNLLYARWLGPGARRKLPIAHGRIQLLSDTRDGCLEYAVSLGESGSLDVAMRRVGRDVLASPNAWLWRPERRAIDATATMELRLPPGISAVLPWPRTKNLRTLDPEAFRFDSYAAFGHFTTHLERVGEVELEYAILDGPLGAEVLPWLKSSIRVATLSDGAFPRDRMQAIVVPSSASSEPVQFGMVARGGSASVLLIVSADAEPQALLRDWVLPHELSHLLLPYVEREHAWLSEGFATYYQEVLLARAGLASPEEALRRLSTSLRSVSAQAGTTPLVEECARLELTRDYRKVYWGGAAYWLNIDVALRRRGLALDVLLTQLRTQPNARELWTARQLIEQLDALSNTQLFSTGFDDAARLPFPPFEEALKELRF
ncbi:MAG TPA: hypothetical protein VFX59_12540 [Polyangiales bacterium]|nr:hypothetical protein [Polyangiales bacterium]